MRAQLDSAPPARELLMLAEAARLIRDVADACDDELCRERLLDAADQVLSVVGRPRLALVES
jgi:hypothetical protein